MANYYGSARTNYFKVKDTDAFNEALSNVPDIKVDGSEEKGYCILAQGGDGAGWPSWIYHEDGTEEEIDLPSLVAEHLADDEVAIFMECGAEKLRYLVGYAEAINNKGERESISLNEIYELAATLTSKFHTEITRCEY